MASKLLPWKQWNWAFRHPEMKMRYWILLAFAGLTLFVIATRSKYPSDRKGQLSMHAHQLGGISKEWMLSGKTNALSPEEFAATWKDFGLIVYTNAISTGGRAYRPLFAVRPRTIPQNGLLAVTADQTVIWIGDDGTVRTVRPGSTGP